MVTVCQYAWKEKNKKIIKRQSYTQNICLQSKPNGISISSQLTLLSSPPCCSPGLPTLRPALALWRWSLLPGRALADRCACCRSRAVWVEVVEGANPAPLPPLSVPPDKSQTIPDLFHSLTLNCRRKTILQTKWWAWFVFERLLYWCLYRKI